MDWEAAGKNCLQKAFEALRDVKTIKVLDDGINPHTDADLMSHVAMAASLRDSGLSCELISEEYGQVIPINGGGSVKVMIDPIDETAFFMRGELSFSSVGMFVVENGMPTYSFVGDLSNGDIYHCDQKQAYKNGVPVTVPGKMPGKYILAGWAPYSPRIEVFYEKILRLPKQEYTMLNFGQMLQAAKITGGGYDACFEILPAKLQEFAGAIVAWRAGGQLTTMEGKPIVWDPGIRQTMLVSRDKDLHQKLLTAFN